MKNILTILFVVLFFQTAIAQNKADKKLVAAVETLRKQMLDPNKESLDALLMDVLSYGHSTGRLDTKASLIESLLNGSSDFVAITLSDQTIQVSGKTAIVRHKLMATTNDGGKPGEAKLAVLLVWQKQHKDWKLLARQAVKLL
jgi:ketosteroid isomerase-like protein